MRIWKSVQRVPRCSTSWMALVVGIGLFALETIFSCRVRPLLVARAANWLEQREAPDQRKRARVNSRGAGETRLGDPRRPQQGPKSGIGRVVRPREQVGFGVGEKGGF